MYKDQVVYVRALGFIGRGVCFTFCSEEGFTGKQQNVMLFKFQSSLSFKLYDNLALNS